MRRLDMHISRRRGRASIIGLAVACACLALALHAAAQQTVPFENGAPIAPAGFEPQPIPAEAVEYDTAEVMRIRVVPIARGLVNPWSLAFLPDGAMLVDGKGGPTADRSRQRARSQTRPRRPRRAGPGPVRA